MFSRARLLQGGEPAPKGSRRGTFSQLDPCRVDLKVLELKSGRVHRKFTLPDERGVRAGEPEQRSAARLALGAAGDEGEDEPRRREQADVGGPAGCPGVTRALEAPEVLVAGTEGCSGDERERDPHGGDATPAGST